MGLKLSPDLKRIVENKKLSLEREDKPRLIINMGNKKGFRPLTDDDLTSDYDYHNFSLDKIKAYVKEHTSNEKKHYDLAEGGVIMVTFEEFVKMINEGYNIYKSEVINEKFISIQYQREIKRDGRGGR